VFRRAKTTLFYSQHTKLLIYTVASKLQAEKNKNLSSRDCEGGIVATMQVVKLTGVAAIVKKKKPSITAMFILLRV
jgi:hypothetical protein